MSQLEDGPQPRGRCSKDSSTSTCRYRGANPSSCRYQWLKQGWKLSVATPWCNDSCRNSRTAPDSTRCSCGVCCGVQPRGVTTVSVLWSAPSSSHCRGANPGFGTLLESLSWCQPRGVTTRVVIRGRRRTVRVVTTEVQPLGSTPWCNDSRCNSRTHASEQFQHYER